MIPLILLLCIAFESAVSSADIPCASRAEDYGYVCVCNETYCDTITSPTKLKSGAFYHYSTSETVPGFTKKKNKFFDPKLKTPFYDDTSDVTVTVNGSVTYQQLTGIGVGLTDISGKLILDQLLQKTLNHFVESVFGENGIEITYIRFPIAGSDFSNRYYTYDDVAGDTDLKYWNLTQEDFDIKLPLLKMFNSSSKREGGVKIMAITWTAPSWMKTNNNHMQGYLLKRYQSTWANYHIKFLQAYKDQGINVWGLSLGNEVILPLYFGPFFGMPNMVMMPNQAREWLKNELGPALKQSGFDDIKIFSLDDERPFANWWSDRMMADKSVAELLDGIALHWYLDSNLSISSLEEHHKKYPQIDMMYTESSINSFQSTSGKAVDFGSWDSGVRYINNMFQNLCHWVTAYMDWNVALNVDGGPLTTENMTLDASIIINETISEFYKQPIFYVLGHFSKFILPGAYRIQTSVKQSSDDPWNEECYSASTSKSVQKPPFFGSVSDTDDATTASPFPTRKPDPPSTTVLVLAAANPDGSRSIIAYNPRTTSTKITITDTDKGTFKATVQPHSINTFIYW